MAEKGFVSYHSYLKTMEPLSDAECGRLYRACLTYSMTGTELELRGNERILWPTMKEQIDRDAAKYAKKCEVLRENAKSKSIRSGSKSNRNASKSSINANANENINIPPKSPQGEPAKRFKAPTVGEVQEYCKEQGYGIDAGSFVDFYASKGWKVGKECMKDWKAAVRTWVRRRAENTTPSQNPQKNIKVFRAADYLGDRVGEFL